MNEDNKKIGGSYDISKIGHVIRVDTQTFNLLSKVRKNINMPKHTTVGWAVQFLFESNEEFKNLMQMQEKNIYRDKAFKKYLENGHMDKLGKWVSWSSKEVELKTNINKVIDELVKNKLKEKDNE